MQIWAIAHGVAVLAATGRWPTFAETPAPEEVMRAGASAVIAQQRSQQG
jgi:hypothetical protein